MSEFGLQWAGQIIDGRFELGEYLGGSENACVYSTSLGGKQAAIKLIRAERAAAKDHLLRWSRTISIAHPSIAQIFETGRCSVGATELVYAVMERADETLAEILPQRPLTSTEVSDMLAPILDALAYLHEKRFVHARIKPSNILAIGDYVKVSSDGICAAGSLPSGLSAYDPPEVPSTGLSAAADVWSLGMVLVEGLTQALPRWSASSHEGPIIPAPVPQPFLEIARNCLWRDPRRRWTVGDISARLQSPATQSAKVETPQVEAPQPETGPTEEEMRAPIQPPFQPVLDRRVRKVTRGRRPLTFGQFVPGAVLVALAAVVILVAPKILNRWQKRVRTTVVEAGPSLASTDKSEAPPAAQPNKTPEAAPTTSSPPVGNETAPAPATRPAENASTEESQDQVVDRVMPKVPQSALNTISGTVKVGIRVQVAPSGDVTAANIDSPGPSKYFANKAVEAANSWKFVPSAANGANANREWILRFEFRHDGAKVIPTTVPE